MIEIDGGIGEGGGQMLRTALGLSMITNQPFKMINIRNNRPTPGLKNQHLYTVQAFRDLAGAVVENATLGSTEITFFPKPITKKTVDILIPTAGSITLVLQSLLIPLVFHKKKVVINISGGTDMAWSPPIDYFRFIIAPQLRRWASVSVCIEKRGYFPQGGGKVKVEVKGNPTPLRPILLNKSHDLLAIRGFMNASNELANDRIVERMRDAARNILIQHKSDAIIDGDYNNSISVGCGITLFAVAGSKEFDENQPMIIGSDLLGKKGMSAEEVGSTCAHSLMKIIENQKKIERIDPFLADMLIPYLGLVGGAFKTMKITEHARTNLNITNLFLENKVFLDEKECLFSVIGKESRESIDTNNNKKNVTFI